jgi:arabinogalactan endo-1,4-beta-galactosidase
VSPFLAMLVVAPAPYWRGADLSFVPEYRDLNAVFKREKGQPVDVVTVMKDSGLNLLRLRLWVNPKNQYCGLESTLLMAKEAKAKGFDILLDFHYSDWWADPGHQPVPVAWANQNLAQLSQTVENYSADVVRRFVEQGTPPKIIAVGNEIRVGMMWPLGKIVNQQASGFVTLLKAGIKGSRKGMKTNSKYWIQVHTDAGGNNTDCRWLFDTLRTNNVDYDMLAVSYYPNWHGTLAGLSANLNDLASRYKKPIMVAETGYPFTLGWKDATNNFVGLENQLLPGFAATPAGQAEFLRQLHKVVRAVPDGLGVGVCFWAPDYVAQAGIETPYENMALFDFENKLMPGARALGEFDARK